MTARASLSTGVFLETITADQAHGVRCGWGSGDDLHPDLGAEDAMHFGVYAGDRLAAVASLCREGPPGDELDGSWRLRSVVTDPAYRGAGLGTLLVKACANHATARGGHRIWCTALSDAEPFLAKSGFRALRARRASEADLVPIMQLSL